MFQIVGQELNFFQFVKPDFHISPLAFCLHKLLKKGGQYEHAIKKNKR